MVIAVKKDDYACSTLKMNVESITTSADIKRCIDHNMRHEKLSPDYSLFFERKQLEDNHTLKDCGVEHESTLLLCKILILHIRIYTRKVITIRIKSSLTLWALKNMIVAREQLVPDPAMLIGFRYLGHSLEYGQTLADCNIENGATLHLVDSKLFPVCFLTSFYCSCITHTVGFGGGDHPLLLILCCPCLLCNALLNACHSCCQRNGYQTIPGDNGNTGTYTHNNIMSMCTQYNFLFC